MRKRALAPQTTIAELRDGRHAAERGKQVVRGRMLDQESACYRYGDECAGDSQRANVLKRAIPASRDVIDQRAVTKPTKLRDDACGTELCGVDNSPDYSPCQYHPVD